MVVVVHVFATLVQKAIIASDCNEAMRFVAQIIKENHETLRELSPLDKGYIMEAIEAGDNEGAFSHYLKVGADISSGHDFYIYENVEPNKF